MPDNAPPIRFYTDTHIAKAIAIQLRDKDVDIIRCEEVGLAEASDVEHLTYATKQQRVIITHDDDFLQLDKQWRTEKKSHAGIIYCLPHLQGKSSIGKIVNLCLDLHELIAGGAGTIEEDIVNKVIYLS